jgi:hypothetical protein
MCVPVMPEAGDTAGYVGRRRGRSSFAMSFVDAAAVVGGAGRLLWRHWPALFALYFVGAAARAWLIKLGVTVAQHNGTAGYLIFLLAPIAFMTCLALMLMVVQPSLSRLNTRTRVTSGDLLRHVTSLLVPFLAVYASLGLAREDTRAYFYGLFEDSLSKIDISGDGTYDITRTFPFQAKATLLAAILIVFAIRWLLPKWDRARGWVVFGLIMGYVEVLWLSELARYISPDSGWVQDRNLAHWVEDAWQRVGDTLGPLRGVFLWIGEQLGNADVVLLAPLGWLLLGAVVYRREIQMSLDADEDKPPPRWLGELPGPMRWLGTGITTDLRGRFGPLANGLRLMARIGWVPTLLFCLLFTAGLAAGNVAWELERLIVGPQDYNSRWWPLSYPLSQIHKAVGLIVVTVLLAAAVDRILLASHRAVAEAAPAPEPGPSTGPVEPVASGPPPMVSPVR